MKTHDELKSELLKNPEVGREYERLAPKFELIEELVAARSSAGLSQADLAWRMGTTQSAIARLEGERSAPTWKTVNRYAEATGRRLRINLEER